MSGPHGYGKRSSAILGAGEQCSPLHPLLRFIEQPYASSHFNTLATINTQYGSANSKMRVSGRPVVKSVVPEVGFFIGRSPFMQCSPPCITTTLFFQCVCRALDKFCAVQ